jgi:hypothetical protein
MLSVSLTQVRIVSAVALAALVFGTVLPMLDLISFEDDVASARLLSTYAALLPSWALWAWSIATGLIAAVGLVGLNFLWPHSRWLLATYALAAVIGQPFLGLAVVSPYEATFGGIFGTCLLWLVAVCFWSPFADRFGEAPRPNAG